MSYTESGNHTDLSELNGLHDTNYFIQTWSDFIRLQGGYFSEYIDVEPDEEKLETDAGLTNVRILEFDLLNYVNFEADIHFAEDEGIVQVNCTGKSMNVARKKDRMGKED